MDGLSIIEGKELQSIKARLASIEQNQLALIKLVQQLFPQTNQSNVPEFISISNACKKYHISTQTLYNKLKLFKEQKKRDIDRIQSGSYYLINEHELQEAIRLKSYKPIFMQSPTLRKVA